MDALYRRNRAVTVGIDENLPLGDLFRFLGRRLRWRLRGALRGYLHMYRGPGVRIAHRRKLSVGNDVVLGPRVSIFALAVNGVTLHDKVTVDEGALIRGSGVIRNVGVGVNVGARTSIGANNVLLGQGGIDIGEDCLLGPNVAILSENHRFGNGVPTRLQGEFRAKVTIGSNVWLGAGSTILPGVKVGDGSVVGAGAVVTKDVAAGEVVGGVPARLLGSLGV